MSLCWSCERDAGGGALCVHCGVVLPPEEKQDLFAVLGLPARFPIDLAVAEARFRELSRQFHPDRFARADPRARKASLQRTVQLNEAWRTVRDPGRRAEYLLKQFGYDVSGEEGAMGPAAGGADGPAGAERSRVRMAVPTALLGEVLELREALLEARAESDVSRVRSLATEVGQRIDGAMASVAAGFERASHEPSSGRAGALESVAHALIALRYYRRFLDEVPNDIEPEGEGPKPTSQAGSGSGGGASP